MASPVHLTFSHLNDPNRIWLILNKIFTNTSLVNEQLFFLGRFFVVSEIMSLILIKNIACFIKDLQDNFLNKMSIT